MDYTDYTEYDFIRDEFFVKWVNDYDKETDQFWQQWIRDHPEKRETVLIARQMIQSIRYKQKYTLSEKERKTVLHRIRSKRIHAADLGERRKGKSNLIKVAASIIILAALQFGYQYWSQWPGVQQEETALVSRQNPAGRKAIFQLSDGTKVKLNAESKLQFPKNFSDTNRIVLLEGEAFFEVARDETRPFLVVTGNITTKVLGTSFHVKNHPQSHNVQVALVHGKVSVLDQNGTSVVLEPDEMVTYSHKNITKSTFDRDLVFGWVDNKLVFDKANAREVVKRLEKWYGVKFILRKEPMFSGLYSGVFEDESLHNVLQGIRYGAEHSFVYEIIEKQVVIKE